MVMTVTACCSLCGKTFSMMGEGDWYVEGHKVVCNECAEKENNENRKKD